MRQNLEQRRQAALDRHDHAIATWADRTVDPFKREMREVVRELDSIAREADQTDGDALERSRTWRWLGDAYFDLAAGKELEALAEARMAYSHAEALLRDVASPLDHGKLNFNFANTLRGLSGGKDRELLEEARVRYLRARNIFGREAPNLVQQVDAYLGTLDAQLALSDLLAQTSTNLGALKEIEGTRTRYGAGETEQSRRDAQRQLKEFKLAGGSVGATRRKAEQIIDDFGRSYRGAAFSAGVPHGDQQTGDRLLALREMLERSSAASGASDPQQAMINRLFRMLLERYQRDVAANLVAPERRQALEPLLADLEALFDQDTPTLNEDVASSGRIKELIARASPLLATPSIGKAPPAPGSRAAMLVSFVGGLKAFLSGEVLEPNRGSVERQAAMQLFARLGATDPAIFEIAENDARLLAYERDVLRQLSMDIDQYALREHLVLAPVVPDPLWLTTPRPLEPNTVFFSGRASIRGLIARVCADRGLTLRSEVRGRGDVGQARWDDLRTAHLAVFDLGTQGVERAAVCYELGMARAAGRRAVIFAPAGETLPFNVDVAPFALGDEEEENGVIAGEAIDAALFMVQRAQLGSSVQKTVAYAKQRFNTPEASPEVRQFFSMIDEAEGDPIEVWRLMQTSLGYIGTTPLRLMRSAWPADYPSPHSPRLFHVMPFSEKWSDAVSRIAADACRGGADYVRGDAPRDPRIIRAIWDEICRATHILVDITTFNANVALELGIAHALGRHVLVVAQQGMQQELFPLLRHVRVALYQPGDDGSSLRSVVAQFLRA